VLVRVHTPSSPVRKRERGGIKRERERGIKRERERNVELSRIVIFIFKRNEGCLGTFYLSS
jgi:hypothetical protein